jgi:hypothetical protein
VIKGNGHDQTETNGKQTEHAVRQNGAGGTADGEEGAECREETQLEAVRPVKRTGKRRNGLIFTLGGIFGVFLALFFANQNELSLEALMDLNLDALIDVIPAGVLRDAKQFSVGDCFFYTALSNYADSASIRSKNARRLATIPSPWVCISRLKVCGQSIPLS